MHNTFGDWTPRQKTVGFLESYTHGGTTTAISASEVHVPGRPKDPEGVKALAVAAKKCFEHFRPGGMRVHAGSIILEPGLTEADFEEIAEKGVWLAKAGFGAVKTPYDYAPMIAWAKKHRMVTTVHTGGSSIPGSSGIWADHLIKMQPDVSFHVNGGPVAMPDEDFPRIVNESKIALQVCTAGNLRTTLLLWQLTKKAEQIDRFLIATDTPTGSGIMPLGMMYTITHLASLTDMPVETAIAAATGNNARVYRLNSGFLKAGQGCRRGAARCLRRRVQENRARRAEERRHRRGRRRDHRRRAAFRRPQPQHAGADEEGAGRRVPHSHGLLRAGALMSYRIRKWYSFVEEILANESAQPADGAVLRKVAVAVALENPYAGRFSAGPRPARGALRQARRRVRPPARRRCSAESKAESVGKACIVGLEGEYEHGNALLTTAFADPVRDALGGGKAWISSTGKRGAAGTAIDVPLAHKDALYVRSHYDTMTLSFGDAPAPREIVVIFAVATRGRLHARLGGLKAADIKGQDGLR